MMHTDILIVGCGVSGLYCALNLPKEKKIVVLTSREAQKSDSFLAQGGICVLPDEEDYPSFYEDTMRAGHYENNPDSVEIMIRSSREVIRSLEDFGVCFEKENGRFLYTREGAHSRPRILFHADETGKEITSHLLEAAKSRQNITLIENFTMVDLVCRGNSCSGIIGRDAGGSYQSILADYTVLATGGIGGLFRHSTNYRHLTGDALALALKYRIQLQNIDYIQIHPTTLYTNKEGRRFLISESVRGEGAVLLDAAGKRFVDELQPRDVVAKAIFEQMKKEGSEHVWLCLAPIAQEKIKSHFPHIYQHCLQEGYDITRQNIPVVPAQHYFMGGIAVDRCSKSSMERLYAVGETACNGVHGKNRLASNSLLESLVFAGRAARQIAAQYEKAENYSAPKVDAEHYAHCREEYGQLVLNAIEREKGSHEQH
ncbi:MAG: L-aspartate oxidase [Provencibacterium sp.]|jgi:L-aspartate oxidase|nr:L-aspartate oxidase [Provencibacterium sp.]